MLSLDTIWFSALTAALLKLILLFNFSSFELLGLSFDFCASHVVISEIALLTHAHGVYQAVAVRALAGHLGTTEALVARGTHILGVMLPVGMGAVSDGLRRERLLGLLSALG